MIDAAASKLGLSADLVRPALHAAVVAAHERSLTLVMLRDGLAAKTPAAVAFPAQLERQP